MSSSTYAGHAGNPDAVAAAAPPPPPPPPPPLGQSIRINTSQGGNAPRRAETVQERDTGYEPPAAIQNAMLTKDKKPFTYTPGMGGKLDLSQIRSPRMARRVAKNANDEGIEGPPAPVAATRPSNNRPVTYVQPQVAVPVFPVNIPSAPQQPPPQPRPPTVAEKPVEQGKTTNKVETKVYRNEPNSPESPSSPTQVTLQKAPTPWLQNKNKPAEVVPEWAKRSTLNKSQVNTSTDERPASPPLAPPSTQYQQQKRQPVQPERVVPIRIEERPSVWGGAEQPKQAPSAHHQQRWSQPQGTFVVPIILEDSSAPVTSNSQNSITQVNAPNNFSSRVLRGGVKGAQTTPPPPSASALQQQQQQEPGPVQSRSFRVLQKITDTDVQPSGDIESEQMRKLHLTEDDRMLMNKFKEQVDGDTYLHQEEDPRYRGAAIPSRAFRFLQNMTDSGEMTATPPRAHNTLGKKQQNRHSKSFEVREMGKEVPASEQQVPEPKKYMGSAIPSRSFRILQAMTAAAPTPESLATEGNHRAVSSCESENRVTANQQARYFPEAQPPLPNPTHPSPSWRADSSAWLGWNYYYPIGYAHNAYDYYPSCKHKCPFCSHQCNDTANLPSNSPKSIDSPINIVQEEGPAGKFTNYTDDEYAPAVISDSVEDCNDHFTDHNDNNDDDDDDDDDDNGDDDNDGNDDDGNDKHEDEDEKVGESDSDCDSDSYLAYSTGLNPLGRNSSPPTTITSSPNNEFLSSEQNDSTDCESDAEYEDERPRPKGWIGSLMKGNEEECEQENTVVSVSFPLRLKFSISENNEDITTIVVGDSRVKCEEVNVETSAHFTLKRKKTKKKEVEEEEEKATAINCTENGENNDFTLINHEESVESKGELEVEVEEKEEKKEEKEEEVEEVEEEERDFWAEIHGSSKEEEKEERVVSDGPTVVVSVCNSTVGGNDENDMARMGEEGTDLLSVGFSQVNSQANSQEESEEEDSGVTSDTSRMISEVDTDSESAHISKRMSKYQRTQTHSRLFRLLCDDGVEAPGPLGPLGALGTLQEAEPTAVAPSNRDYLSLPLRKKAYSYDESYCSNYSSGLTSPEYSPISEQSCRRSQEPDSYFQAWKTAALPSPPPAPPLPPTLSMTPALSDVIPSLAFKTLENKRPYWAYKVNVLCPRIKSSKNVPRAVQRATGITTPPIFPNSYVKNVKDVKNERC